MNTLKRIGIAWYFFGFANLAQAGLTPISQYFNWSNIEVLEANIKHWSKKGMALNAIEAYVRPITGDPGEIVFAGDFQPSNEGWYYTLNANNSTFAEHFAQRLQQGFRIKDLSVVVQNGNPLFSGVWTEAKGQAHGFYYGLTDEAFDGLWKKNVQQEGYRIADHAAYVVGNRRLHAVSLVKDGQGFYFYHGINSQQLQSIARQMADQGFAPDKISTYGGERPTYSIVFLKQIVPVIWYFGMKQTSKNGFEFENRSKQAAKDGYRFRSVAMSGNGSSIAAIWEKPSTLQLNKPETKVIQRKNLKTGLEGSAISK